MKKAMSRPTHSSDVHSIYAATASPYLASSSVPAHAQCYLRLLSKLCVEGLSRRVSNEHPYLHKTASGNPWVRSERSLWPLHLRSNGRYHRHQERLPSWSGQKTRCQLSNLRRW